MRQNREPLKKWNCDQLPRARLFDHAAFPAGRRQIIVQGAQPETLHVPNRLRVSRLDVCAVACKAAKTCRAETGLNSGRFYRATGRQEHNFGTAYYCLLVLSIDWRATKDFVGTEEGYGGWGVRDVLPRAKDHCSFQTR